MSPAQPVTAKPEVERRVGFSWGQGSFFLPCPLYSDPYFPGGLLPWLFQPRVTGLCDVPAV